MEILTYDFMQRAFLAGIITAILASSMGVFIVLKRMSLIGDSLSHAALSGVALGMLFGFYPFYGALIFSVLAGFLIEIIRKAFDQYADIALGVVMSGGMGLAVVLISIGKSFNVLSRELFAITFDEESAKVQGIAVDKINIYFTILTALAVALAVRVVGTLLVSALMVIPAAISLQTAKSFRYTFVIAISVAIFSVVSGLYTSFIFDIAPGGTIVLILSTILIIILAIKKYKE